MPLNEATREGRDSFEVFALFMIAVALVPTVLNEGPESVEALLPFPWYVVWAGFGILGCAGALVGVFMKNRVVGLLVEQVALVPAAICAGSYAAIVLIYNDWNGLLAAAAILGFAVACVRRYRRIQKAFHKAEALAQRQRRENRDGR